MTTFGKGTKKNLSGLKKKQKKNNILYRPIGNIIVNLLEPLFIVITLQVCFHSSLFREVFNDNLMQRVVWVFHTRYSHGASFFARTNSEHRFEILCKV